MAISERLKAEKNEWVTPVQKKDYRVEQRHRLTQKPIKHARNNVRMLAGASSIAVFTLSHAANSTFSNCVTASYLVTVSALLLSMQD